MRTSRIIALGLGALLLAACSPAQAKVVALGGAFGAGYLPMTEWQDVWGAMPEYDYDAGDVGLYGEVYGRVPLLQRHAVVLSVEYIVKEARRKPSLEAPEGVLGVLDWDFTAIPMNLSYEYDVAGPTAATTPFVGGGAGVYYTKVKAVLRGNPAAPNVRGERTGWGYGFHVYLGYRLALAPSLSVTAKVRGRVAEGMGFTDDKNDIDIELTGVDGTAGVELRF